MCRELIVFVGYRVCSRLKNIALYIKIKINSNFERPKFLSQDLVVRASLEQRKLRVTRMRKGKSKFGQSAIFRTINLNYTRVSHATELLVGLTLGTRRPNKMARKIGAGVGRNLEERVESRRHYTLLDNCHNYIFTIIFCINIRIILAC